MANIKLFCLPYAGGSAAIYSKWKELLHPRIEMTGIELAGRGTRIQEPLYEDLEHAVADVFQMLGEDIFRQPYALFGHSLGAVLVYDLAQKIERLGIPRPVHLFFSGKGAPHIPRLDEKNYHLMSDTEFREELIQLGGTPVKFFEHPELVKLFLPLLRNDFRLAGPAAVLREIRPLDQDITVLLGKDDDQTPEQREGWQLHTGRRCCIHFFNGGHFFINEEQECIVRLINDTLIGEEERLGIS